MPLTLKEFYDQFTSIITEIGGTEKIGSHTGIPSLTIYTDDDNEYEVVEVQPDMRIGCGCWQGVDIWLKKK